MAINKTKFELGDIVEATTTTNWLTKGRTYQVVMVKEIAVALGAVYCDYHLIDLEEGHRFKIKNGHLSLKLA